MYIIKTNTTYTEIINPNQKYKDTDLTNLEFAWLSLKESERNVIYFQQVSLPQCEVKYLKFNTDKLVEMNETEKAAKDKELVKQQRIIDLVWENPERNIRLIMAKSLVKSGGTLESYTNNLLIEKTPFYPDADLNGNVTVYLEILLESDKQILLSLGVTIEYLENE